VPEFKNLCHRRLEVTNTKKFYASLESILVLRFLTFLERTLFLIGDVIGKGIFFLAFWASLFLGLHQKKASRYFLFWVSGLSLFLAWECV